MIALNGFYVPKDYPEHLQRIRLKDLETDDVGVPDQQHDIAGVDHRRALQKPLAVGVALQMDQTAFAHQEISWYKRERGEDANLLRGVYPYAHCHRQEGAST